VYNLIHYVTQKNPNNRASLFVFLATKFYYKTPPIQRTRNALKQDKYTNATLEREQKILG